MMQKLPGRPCSPEMYSLRCKVETVLSIDSRGQIILPKDVRKRVNIQDGDKLALISWMNNDKVCCLTLIQTDNLSSGVSGVINSLLAD